ncbi:MAG: formate dehydrogenase subunit gamma [Coriobacteriia bacterium]
MTKRHSEDTVLRQSLANRASHWLIALSTFVLVFTGLGQMPMAGRYGVADLPGMAWTADYQVTLAIHYIAAFVLFFGVVFHVVYALMTRRFSILPRRGDFKESVKIIAAMLGKGEEPPSHKYLAEQRIAYAFIGGSILVVLLSGLVKVVKNLPGVQLDPTVIYYATLAHNISAVLVIVGIIGHFAAFAFKANRAALPAIFNGRMSREVAQHRYSLWYEEEFGEDAQVTSLESESGSESAAAA